MKKKQLSAEQKRLDKDIWIILLVTLGVFLAYSIMKNTFIDFIKNDNISVILRLLLTSFIQFGVAGLGITIVCIFRREKFTQFGLVRKNTIRAIIGTVICFIPYICYVFLSGKFNGYKPFGTVLLTDAVIAKGIPFSIIGMALIVVVWGFFEGFNYAVICDKVNGRYPSKNQWLDIGAITCAVICILFHQFNFSPSGILEILLTFIAIYGMLIVKKKTGNAWGCVFAFFFIWNAI